MVKGVDQHHKFMYSFLVDEIRDFIDSMKDDRWDRRDHVPAAHLKIILHRDCRMV